METPTTELLVHVSVKELYGLVIGVVGYTFLILQSYFKLLAGIRTVTTTAESLNQTLGDLKSDERHLEDRVREVEIHLAQHSGYEPRKHINTYPCDNSHHTRQQ